MHLIILYGPPASGKLTVAKILAGLTKFRLLHNHLVADFANMLFEYGTDEYVNLAAALRNKAIDAALTARISGLIMTFAYGLETKGGERDEAVLKAIAKRVRQKDGRVTFIRLTCDESTLLKRVGRTDRKQFHKLVKPLVLKHILRTYHVNREIGFAKSLTIDTTKTPPATVAKKIMSTI